MRKIALLGLVLLLSNGCGRGHGWLPFFRGARCNTNCGMPGTAPALPASYETGCTNCTTGAGYGSYEGFSGDTYYGGGVITNDYYGGTSEGMIIQGGPYGATPGSSLPMTTLPPAS
jgi:hypothetical protein